MEPAPNDLGLSLSGGGYRAAAFHLGTLKKLNEMQILQNVDVLSTISGGSITGAAWCLHEGDYNSFHNDFAEKLRTKNVLHYIFCSRVFLFAAFFIIVFIGGAIYLSFTAYSYLVFPVLIIFFYLFFKFQYKIFPVSKVIEKAYDKFFFNNKTLEDFKKRPTIAIGSSNLHTGKPFTFSQKKMSDSYYGSQMKPPVFFKHEQFPVSRAVMASSSVPFAFSPVSIDIQYLKDPEDFERIDPKLVDGGVYDNQGIQKITEHKSSYECKKIIVSDAGGVFIAEQKYPNVIALLIRTMDLFMYRIKAFQMKQNIYSNVKINKRPIAYFSLGWGIQNLIPGFITNLIEGSVLSEVIEAHKIDKDWVKDPVTYSLQIKEQLEKNIGYNEVLKRDLTEAEWNLARGVGTNLTSLSAERIACLIRHAENLTELQVKLYCPELVSPIIT